MGNDTDEAVKIIDSVRITCKDNLLQLHGTWFHNLANICDWPTIRPFSVSIISRINTAALTAIENDGSFFCNDSYNCYMAQL